MDVDGSFSEKTPGSSVVPHNELLDAMPECVEDERYSYKALGHGGRVCDATRFVRVAVGNQKPEAALQYKQLMIGWSNGKTFVEQSDKTYLSEKWRQEGEDYLIELKSDTGSNFIATPVNKQGYWTSAAGTLAPQVSMIFEQADGTQKIRTGKVASDLSIIEWNLGSSSALTAFKSWWNCEVRPDKCVASPQPQYAYPEMVVDYNLKRRSLKPGWQFTLPVNRLYEFRWNLAANERADIETFSFDFSDVTDKDKIWLRTQFQIKPDHFTIGNIDENYFLPGTNISAVPGFVPSADPNFVPSFGTWSWNDQQSSVAWLLAGGKDGVASNTDYQGVVSVSSSFTADPCPREGCPDPVDPFAQFAQVRWSQRATWNGSVAAVQCDLIDTVSGLPAEGATIMMSRNATIMFDVETTPILKALHVRGKLYYEDILHANRSLHAINVVVRGHGNVTVECHLSHMCEIVLHGDRFTDGVEAGGSKYGAKGIVVYGELNLWGPKRETSWTKLSAHVEPGATTLAVANVGDFKIGDKIVVSSTDFDANHAETFVITHVQGNTLSLSAAVTHRHRCDTHHGVPTCGEVGLLSRSVRIRGGDANAADSYHSLYEHEFGATITITRRASVVGGNTKWERGRVSARNVGIFDCGQGGFDDRHCLYFAPGLGGDGALSEIKHVSFDFMFAAASYVAKGVSGVRVEDCVGYKSLGSMFVVDSGAGSLNAIVRTLSVLVVTIQTHREWREKSDFLYFRFHCS